MVDPAAAVTGHSRGFVVNGFFEFDIGHLLYSLGVLQFLDQLHLEHFHLHDLRLLLSDKFFFLSYLPGNILPGSHLFFNSEFLYFCSLHSFLLLLQLSLHLIFLGHLVLELLLASLSLVTNKLGLLCFLLLMHDDCVFYLAFFSVSFITHVGYALAVLMLTQLFLTSFLSLNLGSFVILLFKSLHVGSPATCFFNLLPGFHFSFVILYSGSQ